MVIVVVVVVVVVVATTSKATVVQVLLMGVVVVVIVVVKETTTSSTTAVGVEVGGREAGGGERGRGIGIGVYVVVINKPLLRGVLSSLRDDVPYDEISILIYLEFSYKDVYYIAEEAFLNKTVSVKNRSKYYFTCIYHVFRLSVTLSYRFVHNMQNPRPLGADVQPP